MYRKIHKRIIISIILMISIHIGGLNLFYLTNIQHNKTYQEIINIKNLSQILQRTINKSVITGGPQNLYSYLEETYLSNSNLKAIYVFADQDSINLNSNLQTVQVLEQKKELHIISSQNSTFVDILDNRLIFINYSITTFVLLNSNKPSNLLIISIYQNINLPLLDNPFNFTRISTIGFILIWFLILLLILLQKAYFNERIKELFIRLSMISIIQPLTYRIQSSKDSSSSVQYKFQQLNSILHKYETRTIQQLTNEKYKLETLGNLTTDGVIVLDKQLRFVLINKISYQMLPFLKHGINGTYIYNHLPQYINRQLITVLNHLLRQPCYSNQTTNTKKLCTHLENNKEQILEFIITKILDVNRSTLTGFGIVIKDVTKDTELNKAKTQFISNVSHELRTPLFNIKSFLETLCDYENSLNSQEKQEFLMIANQETTRLTNLINDVLSLSYLDSGISYQFRVIDINDIVIPVIQTSQLRLTDKQIDLLFQKSAFNNTVYGYNRLLIQVISNLVDNSLKFTYRGGRVVIKVYNVKSYRQCTNRIRIEIIDDGHGIDIQNQQRIFERFVRIENDIHTLEGTGLGLSIVAKIIQNHSSQIQLYSERFIGSSFWFDLNTIHKKT